MDLQFVGQPYRDEDNLYDFIQAALEDPDVTELFVLSAWAKYSGLARIQHLVKGLRSRGGTARLILGIDEGGATEQGLGIAIDTFNEVHVLHDPAGRTYHPKVYLTIASTHAHLLIGSNNLTAGGLFYNYEAGLKCSLDLTEKADAALTDEVVTYFNRLRADSSVCKKLTASFFKVLISNPKYRISDERTQRRRTKSGMKDVDTQDTQDSGTGRLFEASGERKKGPPKVSIASVPLPTVLSPIPNAGGGGTAAAPPITGAGAGTTASVVRRWFRKLSASDAQQTTSAVTNPTGVVRLNQAGHPIDQTHYFRTDFFGKHPWTSQPTSRGPKDSAVVTFDVVINGKSLGQKDLLVDHAAFREANQSNVTTVLHWGELSAVMRAQSYTGKHLVLEELSDGTYRLTITSAPPGSFTK